MIRIIKCILKVIELLRECVKGKLLFELTDKMKEINADFFLGDCFLYMFVAFISG